MTFALLVPAAAAAQPTSTDEPTDAAAGWLAGELVDDQYIEVTFDFGDGPQTYPDPGLTADVVLALAGAGVASDQIGSATGWLEQQVGAYTGTASGEVYVGSVAKLLLVAEATDRSTTFGGEDLVDLLEQREQDSGRYSDDSESGDFSNTITQSLALLALERVDGAGPSNAAVDHLVDQGEFLNEDAAVE
ncbi:MAG: peptidase, partial [Actinomycetota bacterium]